MTVEPETIARDIADTIVPSIASRSMAARLTGFSRVALDRLIADGVVTLSFAGRGYERPGVSLAEIELVRGRRVTVEDWLRARAELNASYERTKTRKAGQHV